MHYRLILACVAICMPALAVAGHDQATDDLSVTKLESLGPLKSMRDYFAQTSELAFKTSFRETSDLASLGRSGSAKFYIRRPSSFRVELSSTQGDYVFISDGTTFTIVRPKSGKFSRMSASDSIIGTMYLAVGLLGSQAKFLDFIWAVEFGELHSVTPHGEDTVNGKACDRFAIQRFDQSWDICLDRKPPPLPRKVVSRALASNDRSMQTNEFEWIEPANLAPGLFSFVPAPGAREVRPSELE